MAIRRKLSYTPFWWIDKHWFQEKRNKQEAVMKAAAFSILIGLSAVSSSFAQTNEGFGVGAMLGEPSGFSFKWWADGSHAIDGGIAWSLTENDSFHLHADYLFHKFDVYRPTRYKGSLPVYYGLGARFKFKDDHGSGRNADDALIGIRFPLGAAYRFVDSPFDIFIELVPVLDVIPRVDGSLGLAVGGRYYF